MWVMSPPCQPFTRNNTTPTRDTLDPRSKAFMSLLTVLESTEHPPSYIALEVFDISELLLRCAPHIVFLRMLLDLKIPNVALCS